jgi:hypothetical protein
MGGAPGIHQHRDDAIARTLMRYVADGNDTARLYRPDGECGDSMPPVGWWGTARQAVFLRVLGAVLGYEGSEGDLVTVCPGPWKKRDIRGIDAAGDEAACVARCMRVVVSWCRKYWRRIPELNAKVAARMVAQGWMPFMSEACLHETLRRVEAVHVMRRSA